MKKIYLILAPIVFGFFLLISCGGPSKSDLQSLDSLNSALDKSLNELNSQPYTAPETTPAKTIAYSEFKVGNQDKALFKMVDGGQTEIAFSKEGYIEVTAEFEVVKTYKGNSSQVFVSLIALDSDGKTIALSTVTNGEMRSDDSNGSQFLDFLMGEPGYKAKMVFNGQVSQEGTFNPDIMATKEAAKKIVAFKVLTDKR